MNGLVQCFNVSKNIDKYITVFAIITIVIWVSGCSQISENSYCSKVPYNASVYSVTDDNTEPQNTNIPLSYTNQYNFPNCTNSLKWKEWSIIQSSRAIEDYSGKMEERGVYVISRTDSKGRTIAAGNSQPSLHVGEKQLGNYTVSFDYCIPDSGILSFMMYDESDIIFADERLGEEAFWYNLLESGRLDLCTTFGKNFKHLQKGDGKIIAVEEYDATIWNHCTLDVTDKGTEVFINNELITVLDALSNKKVGRLALDGSSGIMFKNFEFR